MAGEYTGGEVLKGVRAVPRALRRRSCCRQPRAGADDRRRGAHRVAGRSVDGAAPSDACTPRPPGFCTGCPERPIFSAMKLVERELGPHHVSADIGCHLFSILPPFNIGNTTMGYGLGAAGASALQRRRRASARSR